MRLSCLFARQGRGGLSPNRLTAALLLVGGLWLVASGAQAAEPGPRRATPAASVASGAGRVIVKYRSDASVLARRATVLSDGGDGAATDRGPQTASAVGARLGLGLRDGRALGARTQVLLADALSSAELVQRLQTDSEVEWVVADQRRFALAAPNDPLYADNQTSTTPLAGQWYLRAPTSSIQASIDIEAAWAVTEGRSRLVVGVLDTGIRADHPDLADKIVSGYDFVGWSGDASVATANDGNRADADPSDPGDWITSSENSRRNSEFYGCGASNSSWHGTQTAGLVGAATHNGIGMAGVAPNVRLLPVRVLGKCGGYDSDIIAGMRWAAGLTVSGVSTNTAHPARVLNLSLGGSGSCTTAYQDAVDELSAAGVVVVAAAGNEGLDVGTPANCSGVVAVAGVRHTGTKVGYSNLGTAVTLAAPAGNCVNETGTCLYPILSTSNTGSTSPVAATYTDGTDYAVGTSFSSPIVAGTVALMLSANPDLTPDQVISRLRRTARAFPSSGADSGVSACQAPTSVAQDSECYCTTSTCGAGLLDAGAAVAAAAADAGAVVSDPVASFTLSASTATVGDTLTLDASASSVDASLSLASYQWSLSSGSSLASFSGSTSAVSTQLLAVAAGTATVTLTVTDSAGTSTRSSQTLTHRASSSGGSGSTSSDTTNSDSSDDSGGGASSAAWALGLLLAGWALRPPRRPARMARWR